MSHGMHRTPTWMSWMSMVQRCTNPKAADWPLYGGRGVDVCSAWREFSRFHADMGTRPEGKTLDRIDNDGSYEPSNCRWATGAEQRANQRPYRLQTRNRSGVKGVRWDGPTHRWTAQIGTGPGSFLGATPDFFEACCLRKSAEHRFSTTPVSKGQPHHETET